MNITEIINQEKLDGIIITDGYNIHFLTGYKGHTGCLLVVDNQWYIFIELCPGSHGILEEIHGSRDHFRKKCQDRIKKHDPNMCGLQKKKNQFMLKTKWMERNIPH